MTDRYTAWLTIIAGREAAQVGLWSVVLLASVMLIQWELFANHYVPDNVKPFFARLLHYAPWGVAGAYIVVALLALQQMVGCTANCW